MNNTTTYKIVKDGILYIIHNVPVTIDHISGEECFTPNTVARIEKLITNKNNTEIEFK